MPTNYRARRRWLALCIALEAVLLFSLLYFTADVSAQEEEPGIVRREYVRVTYYTLPGFMASGVRVYKGAAACSFGYPMGSLLEFNDGWQVTCLDRGLLGRGTGWVDVWAPSLAWGRRYVAGDYGDYTWVRVIRWGWSAD